MCAPVSHRAAPQTLESDETQPDSFPSLWCFSRNTCFYQMSAENLVLQRYEIIQMNVAQTNAEAVNCLLDRVVRAGPGRCCVSCFKTLKYPTAQIRCSAARHTVWEPQCQGTSVTSSFSCVSPKCAGQRSPQGR